MKVWKGREGSRQICVRAFIYHFRCTYVCRNIVPMKQISITESHQMTQRYTDLRNNIRAYFNEELFYKGSNNFLVYG